MSCEPTRIELSNAAATDVVFTVTPDPGAANLTFQVDGLGIDLNGTLSSGSVTLQVPTIVGARDLGIYDATIQVGTDPAISAEVLVVESNVAQTVGVTVDGSNVSYCGGVTLGASVYSKALLSLENQTQWRDALDVGDIGSLDVIRECYTGMILQPSNAKIYFLDLSLPYNANLEFFTHQASSINGAFKLWYRPNVSTPTDVQIFNENLSSSKTVITINNGGGPNNGPVPINYGLFMTFDQQGNTDFRFTLQFTKTT